MIPVALPVTFLQKQGNIKILVPPLSKHQKGDSLAVVSCNLFLAEGNFSNSAPKPTSQVFMDLTLSLCLWASPHVNKTGFFIKSKSENTRPLIL